MSERSCLSRRNVLFVLGGGAAIVAAGTGGWAMTRTPHAALAPWSNAGLTGESDPRRRALSYAILAPNPHNRQPWLVELIDDDTIQLYCDLDRRLPHTDPLDRQITIGLGCFTELLLMALAEDGYAADLRLFPEGEPTSDGRLDERPVARVVISPGQSVAPDPLFAHVLARRTLKEPFDETRAVPDATLQSLKGAASSLRFGATIDADEVERLTDIARRAGMIESLTHRTHKESVDLMRIGKREIEANPDGIDLGGPMLEALSLVGALSRELILDTSTDAFAQGIAIYEEMLVSTRGWCWLISDGNTRADQIKTGADWLRVNLAATSEGLGFHPFSQALQEYPEIDQLFAEIHAHLDVTGGARIQMLSRIGFGPKVPPSPRWPYQTRIATA